MREGLDEQTIAEIRKPEGERRLEPREALAVRWAERCATDFRTVDDAFKEELRAAFDEAEHSGKPMSSATTPQSTS